MKKLFTHLPTPLFAVAFYLLCGMQSAQAQNKFTITGTVVDTMQVGLPNASVMVLQAEDSLISTFTTSDENGVFKIPSVSPGAYIVQVSYMGFITHNEDVTLEKGMPETKALGLIKMKETSNVLGDVDIVDQATPIVFKDDTLEYNASSFEVKPDATVEDLLKELPGVEVDREGTVKAQGEEVTKVLVDGKEFFGDDPKKATKNLPADAIDKVQVFDKKSEFSEFTGFDDGERTKTINLTLRKDKKKGVFGNVSAGYGTEDRYEVKTNINRFAQKYQLSGIGNLNNINQQGFSWQDYADFMGGVRNMYRDGGSNLPIGFGMSDGFMTSGGAGLNFNLFKTKKSDFNASYFYNGLNHDITQTSFRETFLDTGTFINDSDEDQFNKSSGHSISMKYRLKPDSVQDISLRGSGSISGTSTNSTSLQSTYGTDGELANLVYNDYFSGGDVLSFNGSAAYRRKFKRKGRALALELSGNMGDNETDGDLFTENRFYTDGVLTSRDSVLQDQLSRQNSYSYDVELTYIEPIGKREFLKFDYDHHEDMTDFARDFYDIQTGNNPSVTYNDSLSNGFNKHYDYDRAIMSLRLVRDKAQFTFGVAGQVSRLEGELSDVDDIRKEFRNILPSMQFRYEFSRMSRFTANYTSSVSAPSIEQLRPTIDNNDPLNLYIGNPDLVAEVRHNLRLGYMKYSQFTFTSLFGNVGFTYTENRIVNAQSTNANFVRMTMPVNTKDHYMVNGFLGFNTPIKPIKTKFNAHVNSMVSRGITPVNGRDNITTTMINGIDVSLTNYFKDDFFNLEVGVELSLNDINYSESQSANQNYTNSTYYADLIVYLGKKWTVEGELDYAIYGDQGQGVQEIPIVKAAISRSLMNEKARLKVSGFDLLDRNQGFNRVAQLNYIQEDRINSLGRFFMVTFSYKFTMIGK